MHKGLLKLYLLPSLFILGTCARDETATPPADSPSAPIEEPADEEAVQQKFAPEIIDTIEIEGMEEEITLNLFEPDAEPFLIYMPVEFVAEEAITEEGYSVKFHTNYGGEKREDVYLQIFLFPEAITEEPTVDTNPTLADLLSEMDELSEEEWIYDWSLQEFRSENGSNQAMLGEHNGRYFLLVFHSNVEFSEGFYPRAYKMVEHLYWTDTQEYLFTSER